MIQFIQPSTSLWRGGTPAPTTDRAAARLRLAHALREWRSAGRPILGHCDYWTQGECIEVLLAAGHPLVAGTHRVSAIQRVTGEEQQG